MNRHFLLFAICFFMMGCAQSNEHRTNATAVNSSPAATEGVMTTGNVFIPVDSANRMINSYLSSIHYTDNDSDLRSVIFDADSVRQMLNDTAQGRIVKLKIMFAHTLSYINSGNQGQPAGYKSNELTLLLAGYDQNGNYIYHPQGMVPDNGIPCPSSCPASGSAASDTLTN